MTTGANRARLDAYLDAHRLGDVEAALACLADDFRLTFPGGFAMTKDDLRSAAAWDRAVHGHVAYETLEESGDTLAGVFTERNDFFTLLGLEGLRSRMTFRFGDGGEIVEQTYEPLPDQTPWQSALEPAIAWAQTHDPAELAEIYPDGRFVYTAEMAERWLALLRAWRATGGDAAG